MNHQVQEVVLVPSDEERQLTEVSDMYAVIQEPASGDSYAALKPVKKRHTLAFINRRTIQIQTFVTHSIYQVVGALAIVALCFAIPTLFNSQEVTDNLKGATENLPLIVNDIGAHAAASVRNMYSMSDGLAHEGVVISMGQPGRRSTAGAILDLLFPSTPPPPLPLLPSNSGSNFTGNSSSVINGTVVR